MWVSIIRVPTTADGWDRHRALKPPGKAEGLFGCEDPGQTCQAKVSAPCVLSAAAVSARGTLGKAITVLKRAQELSQLFGS